MHSASSSPTYSSEPNRCFLSRLVAAVRSGSWIKAEHGGTDSLFRCAVRRRVCAAHVANHFHVKAPSWGSFSADISSSGCPSVSAAASCRPTTTTHTTSWQLSPWLPSSIIVKSHSALWKMENGPVSGCTNRPSHHPQNHLVCRVQVVTYKSLWI